MKKIAILPGVRNHTDQYLRYIYQDINTKVKVFSTAPYFKFQDLKKILKYMVVDYSQEQILIKEHKLLNILEIRLQKKKVIKELIVRFEKQKKIKIMAWCTCLN